MSANSRPTKPAARPPDFFSPDVSEARRFYLDLRPPKNVPLAVFCGGAEHCTRDFAIRRDTFPYFSLEYVARGRGEVKLNRRVRPLQPGTLFSYGPGISQRITSDPAAPLVKYFVDFSGTRALRLLRACRVPPGHVTEVYPANAVAPIFEELIRAGSHTHRDNGVLCAKLLECLMLKISASRAPREGAGTGAFASFQRCREFVEANGMRLQTLDQIAVGCHVTTPYLCRLFKRFGQTSPYQFLLRLKMNRAAELLQRPGTLVKEVAGECGFPDPLHFSRVFRSVFGLSPAAFRGMVRTAPTKEKAAY